MVNFSIWVFFGKGIYLTVQLTRSGISNSGWFSSNIFEMPPSLNGLRKSEVENETKAIHFYDYFKSFFFIAWFVLKLEPSKRRDCKWVNFAYWWMLLMLSIQPKVRLTITYGVSIIRMCNFVWSILAITQSGWLCKIGELFSKFFQHDLLKKTKTKNIASYKI